MSEECIASMEIITLIAIIIGPVAAVLISLFYQDRKEKHDSKLRIFGALMSHRKTYPPPYEKVQALNLIEVVFHDCEPVLKQWHEYYDLLHSTVEDIERKENHKHIELLSEMAKHLGYNNLEQINIDKFYTPTVHGAQNELNTQVQLELLRVLQNTQALSAQGKDNG